MIGAIGDPVNGYTIVVGSDIDPAPVLRRADTELSSDARKLVQVQVGQSSVDALRTTWAGLQAVLTATPKESASEPMPGWYSIDPLFRRSC